MKIKHPIRVSQTTHVVLDDEGSKNTMLKDVEKAKFLHRE